MTRGHFYTQEWNCDFNYIVLCHILSYLAASDVHGHILFVLHTKNAGRRHDRKSIQLALCSTWSTSAALHLRPLKPPINWCSRSHIKSSGENLFLDLADTVQFFPFGDLSQIVTKNMYNFYWLCFSGIPDTTCIEKIWPLTVVGSFWIFCIVYFEEVVTFKTLGNIDQCIVRAYNLIISVSIC